MSEAAAGHDCHPRDAGDAAEQLLVTLKTHSGDMVSSVHPQVWCGSTSASMSVTHVRQQHGARTSRIG